jgi:osmotically-inducible protein OsmY
VAQKLFLPWLLLGLALLLPSCTSDQQRKAEQRSEDAKREARKAAAEAKQKAKEFAADTKRDAQKLSRDIDTAVNSHKPDSETADEKLHGAAQKTAKAGRAAKREADRLALETRVKTALANGVGLKTLSDLSVDAEGSEITLTGTVQNAADKDRAVQTASSVSGVSRVVNRIQVQP